MLALQNFCGCAFDCKSNSGKEAQQLRDAFQKFQQNTLVFVFVRRKFAFKSYFFKNEIMV